MNKKWLVLTLALMLVFGFSTTALAATSDIKNNNMVATESKESLQVQNTTEDDSIMAAPAIAACILKYNEVNARYGTGKNGGNFIADVAKQFPVAGKDVSMHDYCVAVLLFLNDHQMMTKDLLMPMNMFFGNVVAEDFGVMNFSGVKGYSVGFGLTDSTAADVQQVVIQLYNGTTILGTVTSSGVLTNYPNFASLSAPFDVLGTFNYIADGNWTYSGWIGNTSVIPTKAVITVTFKNGSVKTAVNENLTGDTTIFEIPAVVIDTTKVYGATVTSWYTYNAVDYLDTSVNFNFDNIAVGDIDSVKFTLYNGNAVLGTRTSEGTNLVTLLQDCAQYWGATPATYLTVTGLRTMSAAFTTRVSASDNGYWVSSPSTIANPQMPTMILVEVQIGNIIYQAVTTY